MMKELSLTQREERVLRLVVYRQATDPISRYLQRPIKGLSGILVSALVVVIALSFGLGLRIVVDRFGFPLLIFILVTDGLVARLLQVPVRERLIRKLYKALDEESAAVNRLGHEAERPIPAVD